MSDESQVFDEAEIKAALKENHKETMAAIEKANEEATNAGSVAAETKAAVDKLTEKGVKLHERLAALEQKGIGGGEPEEKSGAAEFASAPELQEVRTKQRREFRMETKTALINAPYDANQPLVAPDHMVQPFSLPFQALTFWNILPKGRTNSNNVVFARATRTNNAGPQVGGSPEAFENVTKPESAYSFARVSREVYTYAHFLPVSEQMLEDAPFLETWLQGELTDGLRDQAEYQCLLGSGANGDLSGAVTEATPYAIESPEEASHSRPVRVRSAIAQLEAANFAPNFILLHSRDWYRMEVDRINPGTDNRFIWSNPQNAADKRLWGLPVIVNNRMTQGSFLIGDINKCRVLEKSGIAFAAAYQDSDNFQKNMVTFRAECRMTFIVHRTEAFVTGSLTA